MQYFKGAEVQRRGALHFHLLIRGTDRLRVGRLRTLALRHGFGHAVDVQPVQPGHAGYVAKYVSKSADARGDVPWHKEVQRAARAVTALVDYETGEVRDHLPAKRTVVSHRPTFRTWSCSRDYGDPMTAVRAAQAHFAAVTAALPAWDARPAPRAWAMLADAPQRPDPPPFLEYLPDSN